MLQIVAVSVTDNSARLNANVATSFYRADFDAGTDGFVDDQATRGHTPADVALIGSNGSYNWSVGFFDVLANSPEIAGPDYENLERWIIYDHTHLDGVQVIWDFDTWRSEGESSFLDELGVELGTGGNSFEDANSLFAETEHVSLPNDVITWPLNPTADVTSRNGRLRYWLLAGKDPFDASDGFRPFTLADELELRSYEGNNNQFVASRFEVTLNSPSSNESQFIRSSFQDANEVTEVRDQLTNQQLVFDNRRKLTMFNGSRNDLLPPWLRWEERFWKRHNPEGFGNLNNPFSSRVRSFRYETSRLDCTIPRRRRIQY